MAQTVPPRKKPATLAAVGILLAASIAGSLWVPIYARVTPKLGPFPFFYWYQLALVPAVALLCWICYLLMRSRPAPHAGRPGDGGAAR